MIWYISVFGIRLTFFLTTISTEMDSWKAQNFKSTWWLCMFITTCHFLHWNSTLYLLNYVMTTFLILITLWGWDTLRLRQKGHHFPDNIFKCIFLNENVWISIKISLMFVPEDPINNIPALVQIITWRRPADKPLSEPMMAPHWGIYDRVTWPQWVNCFYMLFSIQKGQLEQLSNK